MKDNENRLAARVAALTEAVEAADGRANPVIVAEGLDVARRAGQRMALSGDYTVVALAGSTGSGKSSLFNALTDTEYAQVATRRPTTAKAMAVGWGTQLPHDLLDWLDVGKRHLIATDDERLSKLVLLDLPDHDSTESAHRVTVDRMVELVDAIIWVVDPQKYADSALHDGYLKPLADHADIMMVVLNQVDRLRPEELDYCVKDLRRLLDSEGLRSTPVMATSALRGRGVVEVRDALLSTVARKRAMTQRVSLAVKRISRKLIDDLGPQAPAKLNASLKEQVVEAMGDAAGMGVVVSGVRAAWRRRGTLATGWPLVSWLARLRPDPLRKLRLSPAKSDEVAPTEPARTSLPQANAVQKARVDQARREMVERAAGGMPGGWVTAVRAAANTSDALLFDELDVAIATTDLKIKAGAWWWGLFAILQWLLILGVAAGLVWWLAGATLVAAGIPLPASSWYGFPSGAVVAAASVVLGLLLSLIGRGLVAAGAETRARRARTELMAAVSAVVEQQVFAPVQTELDRYHQARARAQAAVR